MDIWSWEKDIHEDWMVELESSSRYEGVHKLIEATRNVHGDSIAAYLCYMAIRRSDTILPSGWDFRREPLPWPEDISLLGIRSCPSMAAG